MFYQIYYTFFFESSRYLFNFNFKLNQCNIFLLIFNRKRLFFDKKKYIYISLFSYPKVQRPSLLFVLYTFQPVSVWAVTVSCRAVCAFCYWTDGGCTPVVVTACPPAWTTEWWPRTSTPRRWHTGTATTALRPRPIVASAAVAVVPRTQPGTAAGPRTTIAPPVRPRLRASAPLWSFDGPWRWRYWQRRPSCSCGYSYYWPPLPVSTRAHGSGTLLARPTYRDRMAARRAHHHRRPQRQQQQTRGRHQRRHRVAIKSVRVSTIEQQKKNQFSTYRCKFHGHHTTRNHV